VREKEETRSKEIGILELNKMTQTVAEVRHVREPEVDYVGKYPSPRLFHPRPFQVEITETLGVCQSRPELEYETIS
jgi:hypothetical protein